MKKIIAIIVIIGALALLYTIYGNFSTDTTSTSVTSENNTFRPDPSNATFIFEDGPVTLSKGRSDRPVAPSSMFTEEIVLLDELTYEDINADGKEDVLVLLARYGAGSGTFIYLGAFVSGPVTYRGSKVAFIGDRIAPQSITAKNGIITVEYLDRGEDEPFSAEPTVSTSKQFVYQGGEFEER